MLLLVVGLLPVAEHLDTDIGAHQRAGAAAVAIVIFLQRGRVESAAVEGVSNNKAASRTKLDAEQTGFAAFGIDSYVAHVP